MEILVQQGGYVQLESSDEGCASCLETHCFDWETRKLGANVIEYAGWMYFQLMWIKMNKNANICCILF